MTRPRRRFSLREGNRTVRPTDRRSKMISAPTNFNHISHMGPGNGIQVYTRTHFRKFFNQCFFILYYAYGQITLKNQNKILCWCLSTTFMYTYSSYFIYIFKLQIQRLLDLPTTLETADQQHTSHHSSSHLHSSQQRVSIVIRKYCCSFNK